MVTGYLISPTGEKYEITKDSPDSCTLNGVTITFDELSDWLTDWQLSDVIDALECYHPGFIEKIIKNKKIRRF